ncbi:Hypothetical protein PHPALM_6560 [Phytophthora palmivora]|uniref:C2H2-type domain-containing protein n=1 Tax=Phytophthora palmivora TaxID=4796 RepID=A0A2P4YEI8_9STRA|nr:Hypothetical protein PHPALM_6560 [Phytophthora palmivora]
MYACLVDGCSEMFKHDDKRNRHLVHVHQFPESFSFHQRRKQKENGSGCVKHDENNEKLEVDTETAKRREARKRRRQQKKKKLAEQAKFQGADMQIDTGTGVDSDINSETTQSVITDVDMADLQESMQDLRIPKSVHFGRKRRI